MSLLRFGKFEFDPTNFHLQRGEKPLRVERIPMDVLMLLVERRGELVRRQEVIEHVWGRHVMVDVDNALNTAIRKLRHVLRDDPKRPKYIETVPSKGYRFIGVVTSAPLLTVVPSHRMFPSSEKLRQTNLPIPTSSLIGRGRELAEAQMLLASERLLTLTGPGGSGKTRLALQLGAEMLQRFPDGVFWVPLHAIRDSNLVEGAIRASVGAENALVSHLGSKRVLIILDTFEPVVEAAPVVAGLIANTSNTKILVTSRVPLHVDFERRYPVEPLSEHDAALLFTERANAIAPDFSRTSAVEKICRQLDCLPLAIELAAGRVALLHPDDLLARLDRRLPLLTTRSLDAPTRQRTMRATIGWSYELLDPDEQQVFRRVGVFAGSFSVEAAERVCGADLDALESLTEKNLIRRWDAGRLGLLDTIREYALERLNDSPEAEDVHRRHAEFFLVIGESTNLAAGRHEVGKPMRHDIASLEQDNIRGALAWAVANVEPALGLALATSVESFWSMHDPREGIRWFSALFALPGVELVAPEVRAHALRAYGSSTDIAGDDDGAAQLYERSLALFSRLRDEKGRAALLHRLGIQAMRRGELAHARELVEASHAIHVSNNNRWGLLQTIGTLGALARDAGDAPRAFELIAKSASLARETAVPWWESGMLAEMAQLALDGGRIDEGENYAREALAVANGIRDRAGRVFGVGLFARIAAERRQFKRAARLWRAIECENVGAPLGGWRRHRPRCEERIREAADPEFERGLAEGQSMTLDDAVSLALRTGE